VYESERPGHSRQAAPDRSDGSMRTARSATRVPGESAAEKLLGSCRLGPNAYRKALSEAVCLKG